MILACFIKKMTFNNKINCEYCCDNCIYNYREAGQVPMFEAYDVIAKLGIMYASTAKYSNRLLNSKR